MSSFLQTEDWLQFQKLVGRKVWRFDNGKIKANIIKHDLLLGKNYLYIPHGPEINFNASLTLCSSVLPLASSLRASLAWLRV